MNNEEIEKKLFKKNLEILHETNNKILEKLFKEIKRLTKSKIEKFDIQTKKNL